MKASRKVCQNDKSKIIKWNYIIIISQQIILFVTTAVRNSDPTYVIMASWNIVLNSFSYFPHLCR
jgi:hypothetical protein